MARGFYYIKHTVNDTEFPIYFLRRFTLNDAALIKIRYRGVFETPFKMLSLTVERWNGGTVERANGRTGERRPKGGYFIINVIIYRAAGYKGWQVTFIKIPGPMEK